MLLGQAIHQRNLLPRRNLEAISLCRPRRFPKPCRRNTPLMRRPSLRLTAGPRKKTHLPPATPAVQGGLPSHDMFSFSKIRMRGTGDSAQLPRHTARLPRHSVRLPRHSARLPRHTARLPRHTDQKAQTTTPVSQVPTTSHQRTRCLRHPTGRPPILMFLVEGTYSPNSPPWSPKEM